MMAPSDEIFAGLAARARWVPWRLEWNPKRGKFDKIPWDGYRRLSTATPQHWMDLATARRIVAAQGLDGAGLVVTGPPIVDGEWVLLGMDFDELKDPVTDIPLLDVLDTYTEFSPSGVGIRAFAWAPKAWADKYRDSTSHAPTFCDHVEVYIGTAARFLTVTFEAVLSRPIRRLDPATLAHIEPWMKPFDDADFDRSGDDLEIGNPIDLSKAPLNDVERELVAGEAAPGTRSETLHNLLITLLRIGHSGSDVLATLLEAGPLWQICLDHRNQKDSKAELFARSEVARAKARVGETFFKDEEEERGPTAAEDNGWGWLKHDGTLVAKAARQQPPPRDWFVHQRLLAGRGHLLTGVGGSSKSQALYQLGVGAVIGRLLWGWEIEKTGTAVLLMTEDTVQDAQETLWDIYRAMMLTDEETKLCEERLHVWPLAGEDVKLLVMAGPVLTRSARGVFLVDKLKTIPDLVFVGLDPVLSLTAGEEQKNEHQRELGLFLDKLAIRTGACVVGNSHSTKSSTKDDEVSGHSSRGGGAITDAVRGEFAMRTMTAKEAEKHGITDMVERKSHVQLIATKGNKMPPEAFTSLWLRRGAGGVLHEVELSLIQEVATTEEARQALDLLVGVEWTKLEKWRGACEKAGVLNMQTSDDARAKAMQRIVKALMDAGWIERSDAQRGAYRRKGQTDE